MRSADFAVWPLRTHIFSGGYEKHDCTFERTTLALECAHPIVSHSETWGFDEGGIGGKRSGVGVPMTIATSRTLDRLLFWLWHPRAPGLEPPRARHENDNVAARCAGRVPGVSGSLEQLAWTYLACFSLSWVCLDLSHGQYSPEEIIPSNLASTNIDMKVRRAILKGVDISRGILVLVYGSGEVNSISDHLFGDASRVQVGRHMLPWVGSVWIPLLWWCARGQETLTISNVGNNGMIIWGAFLPEFLRAPSKHINGADIWYKLYIIPGSQIRSAKMPGSPEITAHSWAFVSQSGKTGSRHFTPKKEGQMSNVQVVPDTNYDGYSLSKYSSIRTGTNHHSVTILRPEHPEYIISTLYTLESKV
ncbi:hypothetical protein DFP72DRAFT_846259 [Ephemerocybe angulata]|uniref:Uncharacterized protein n=1 Tax=Ephemerocybe angulata TaxID=980116 RepID=A0A8H6I0Y2_9AGAR|nr:hypothetical protein DFP72DRAFT_846259 [Tulosesus angulatus]